MVSMVSAIKQYGDYKLDISLEIPAGRVTGLVGKNGAGKSTTIKMILGLVAPDAGEVKVFGQDARKLSLENKERMGIALAEAGFSKFFAPNDIMLIMKKMYKNFDADLFTRRCKEFDIPMKKKTKEFSTGMRAKLRVLLAMCHKADLLVLDEPTAGLDVEARAEILDMLRKYMAENEERSILITSHISTDLEGLCDDIYLIDDGKVLIHEETGNLLENYGVLKLTDSRYEEIDKTYILSTKKESFGYSCITGERQFYQENYPDVVIEKSGIDELILMMTGGNR